MSKRWFIYHDDQPSGPYSAAEIRQLLREGSVDPFDFVSLEGSQLKQELVEVDEIFSNENINYQEGKQQAAGGNAGFVAQIAERSFSSKDKVIAADTSAASSSIQPGQHIALASDVRKIGNSDNLPVPVKGNNVYPMVRKKKKDPKRYHLIDPKGRVLGPLSPGEIQSLYYRGVVDKNVKVMRDGSDSVVQVGKFVSAYADAQGMARIPKQGAHPNIQGVSKSALNRMALMRRAEQVRGLAGVAPVTMAILGIAALLIIVAVALLLRDGTMFKGNGSTKREVIQDAPNRTVPRSVQPRTKKMKAVKKPRKIKREPIRFQNNGGVLIKPSRNFKPAVRNQRLTRPRKTKPAYTPSVQKVEPFYFKPKPLPKPVIIPPVVQQPKPVVKPFAQPVAKPVAKKPSGPTVGSLVDGQSVSDFGPLRFSKDAVKNCDGACTVTFFGAGGSVTIAFFKNAWGDKLLAKSGGVYITGMVRKSGGPTKIILTGVR